MTDSQPSAAIGGGVVPPYRPWITGVAALAIALIGLATFALPPYPMPAWLIGAFTVGPVEHWWYSLSDAHRQKWLYDVGTILAAGVYPAILFAGFWFWTRPLRRGFPVPWRRASILLAVVGLASAAWYVTGWRLGMQYQGETLLVVYVLVNVLWFSLTAILIRFSTSFRSWWANLLAYFSLFVWLVTIAFPWLGEMI